jgi:hypothetical protein
MEADGGPLKSADLDTIDARVMAQIDAAVASAKATPLPPESDSPPTCTSATEAHRG